MDEIEIAAHFVPYEELLAQSTQNKFFYLASPYSHPDKDVQEIRAFEANRLSGLFMEKGIYVVSTIWCCHKCSVDRSLPGDHVWWMGYDRSFIEPAAGVLVLCMPGWKESKGVKYEIELAKEFGKPVYYVNTESLIVWRRSHLAE